MLPFWPSASLSGWRCGWRCGGGRCAGAARCIRATTCRGGFRHAMHTMPPADHAPAGAKTPQIPECQAGLHGCRLCVALRAPDAVGKNPEKDDGRGDAAEHEQSAEHEDKQRSVRHRLRSSRQSVGDRRDARHPAADVSRHTTRFRAEPRLRTTLRQRRHRHPHVPHRLPHRHRSMYRRCCGREAATRAQLRHPQQAGRVRRRWREWSE